MGSGAGKIYTRFGDGGQTRLLSGETVGKDDLRVNAYGALDELQSHLGLARALATDVELRSILQAVQESLFVAGAELASTPGRLERLKRRITPEDAAAVECTIDRLSAGVGLPRSFVVPGSSPESAALHVARSVCRRVERLVVQLNRSTGSYGNLIVYLNRLSDLLFVMAWSAAVYAVVGEVLDGLVHDRKRD